MRRRIKYLVRRGAQVLVWLFILYMGFNIISRGAQIIYGKSIEELAGSAVENAEKGLGVELMKKSDAVFSYLYEEEKKEDMLFGLIKKIYILQDGAFGEKPEYPKEDSVYGELLAEKIIRSRLYDSSFSNESIPVISVLPDYNDYNIGEGDSGEDDMTQETEGMETIVIRVNENPVEVLSPVRQPIKPEIIGNEYTLLQLSDFDFMLKKFYAVESNTTVNSSLLDVSGMLKADMTLKTENPAYPQILILHTHSQEAYKDSRPGVIADTVVGMGDYLTEILENDYGYHVIHVTTEFDCLGGKVDRSKAYEYAMKELEEILNENPSIEVIIDLHRDGVDESLHLVTEYNGKKAAKIMFVNGISKLGSNKISYLPNPNLSDNLAFSMQLQLKGEAYFPGLMRRIIIKAYRYNLHFRGKSALVELGAQTNTVEEARNAIELLAVMLHEVLQ